MVTLEEDSSVMEPIAVSPATQCTHLTGTVRQGVCVHVREIYTVSQADSGFRTPRKSPMSEG